MFARPYFLLEALIENRTSRRRFFSAGERIVAGQHSSFYLQGCPERWKYL